KNYRRSANEILTVNSDQLLVCRLSVKYNEAGKGRMFSPRLVLTLKRLVPSSLYKRLDPFETAIESFVRTVAAEIPAGKRVLDAGSGEGRFKPLFLHAAYVGIASTQGGPPWYSSTVDLLGGLEELPFRSG